MTLSNHSCLPSLLQEEVMETNRFVYSIRDNKDRIKQKQKPWDDRLEQLLIDPSRGYGNQMMAINH